MNATSNADSTSMCIHHGYFDAPHIPKSMMNLKAFFIPSEEVLFKIAREKLFPENAVCRINSAIDLKDRNIIVIYKTLCNPSDSFGVKKIEVSGLLSSMITIDVVCLAPPGNMRGLSEMRGECLVLSFPKGGIFSSITKNNIAINFVDFNLFEEVEFKQFNAMNHKEEFDEYGGKLSRESYDDLMHYSNVSLEYLEAVEWYQKLDPEEKEAVKQCLNDKNNGYDKLKTRVKGPSLN